MPAASVIKSPGARRPCGVCTLTVTWLHTSEVVAWGRRTVAAQLLLTALTLSVAGQVITGAVLSSCLIT